jgi:hypothetical protein
MRRGVVQGSPISGLIFNLTQADTMIRVRTSHPDNLILSLHDDHFIVGPPEQALTAAGDLALQLKEIGLDINLTKSKIYSPSVLPQGSWTRAHRSKIQIVDPRGGVIVAGVPIGTKFFMTSYCLGKVDTIINTMKQVERIVKEPSFESSCQLQTTFYLARVSFQQQLGYWLRCTPPDQTLPAANLLDTRMVEFILNIMRLEDYRPERTVTRSPISERLFLPLRMGGNGFTSAKATRISAYLGSVALSAKIIGDIAPHLKTEAGTQPWPSLVQFFQGFNEAKANPHLRLEDHFQINDIWEAQVYKFQARLTQAVNAKRKAELWATVPEGRPRTGAAMVGAFSSSQYAIRQQAMANEDSSASAWLTANPAWPDNRMNDATFRTAFQLRNLIPVVTGGWCKCGKEMDPLSSHMYVCSDLPTRNKIRNTMHKKVCESVKKISKYYFREVDMDLINGEPLCAEYLPLKVGVDNPRRRRTEREEEERDSMVRRRADLGFKGRVRSVLVDCTTASPLAKEVKDYKPGKAADAATKRKVKDYQRFYDIQQTNRCSIFFFAVETTGGLGKEARDYVKLLAKLAGGTLSATILRIYQTLAVEFQCARANQVYITNRKYVTSTPPSLPLPHPIPPVT